MATQNFVAGGFYGKLGDMVGQRWRNKRTLRRWVKGANPQTPEQQANRALFASSVRLAQEAKNINPNASYWQTPDKPEFSLRTGLAKLALQEGLSEADSLPLIPRGYVPFFTFTYASSGTQDDPIPPAIGLLPGIPEAGRLFSYCVRYRDLLTGEWLKGYFQELFTNTGLVGLHPNLPIRYGFDLGSYVEGVTIDDDAFQGHTYYLARRNFSEDYPPIRRFNLSPVRTEETTDYFRFVYSSIAAPFETDWYFPTTFRCMKNGVWGTYYNIGKLTYGENLEWYNTIQKQGMYTFPTGSTAFSLEDGIQRPYYELMVVADSWDI